MSSVWPEAFVNNDVVRKLTSSLTEISGGSWKVNVKYGVNKNTAFDDAKSGKVHMTVGHSTYWPNMKPASAFFASIPFGLGHAEFSAWISFGGGRKYWEELYAPHGLYPLPAGDTGMQMVRKFISCSKIVCRVVGLRRKLITLVTLKASECVSKVLVVLC
jgi:TRAP-type mannitol/chloroaromatic compound transport system substrate-binding protein